MIASKLFFIGTALFASGVGGAANLQSIQKAELKTTSTEQTYKGGGELIARGYPIYDADGRTIIGYHNPNSYTPMHEPWL